MDGSIGFISNIRYMYRHNFQQVLNIFYFCKFKSYAIKAFKLNNLIGTYIKLYMKFVWCKIGWIGDWKGDIYKPFRSFLANSTRNSHCLIGYEVCNPNMVSKSMAVEIVVEINLKLTMQTDWFYFEVELKF